MGDNDEKGEELQKLLEELQKIGILIENRAGVLTLVQRLEQTVEELKQELEDVYSRKKKADNEIHSLMLQDVENRKKISDLEDNLRSHRTKEPLYQTVPTRRGSSDSQQLKDVIVVLQKERDALKDKVIKLEQKATNGHDSIASDKVARLQKENVKLLNQIDSLKFELNELKLTNDKLSSDWQPDTLTFVNELELANAKLRQLDTECERLVKENKRLTAKNADLKDEIAGLKDLQEVVARQRDAECSNHRDQIDILKKEKLSLMDQLEEKVEEIHCFKEGKDPRDSEYAKAFEELTITNKDLQDELNSVRLQLGDLEVERARLERKASSFQKEVGTKYMIIQKMQKEIQEQEGRRISTASDTYLANSTNLPNAINITLTKVDLGEKEKKFGVKMMSKPSRVVVTEVSEKQQQIRPGDYVIRINDVNVQHSDTDILQNLGKEEYLNMTIVRPRDCFQDFNISNQRSGVEAKLSITVSKLSNAARRADVRLGDEIIKINDVDVNLMPPSKIEQKLSKSSVKLSIRRTLDELDFNSPLTSNAYERIDDFDRGSPKSSLQHSRSRSRRSIDSSHSSSVSGGSSEIHKDSVSQSSIDIHRMATGSTLYRAHDSFKNEVTEQDIVARREGAVILNIRNTDTDGSGDTDVAGEEQRTRRSAREESEDAYVEMSSNTEDKRRLSAHYQGLLTDHQLSTIAESSLPEQNGMAQSASLDSLKMQEDEVCSQHSPIPGRPPQPLPPCKHESGAYEYVDRKFSTAGFQREIILQKNVNVPSFGFTIFGGNKVGIFVDHVEKWQPAESEGLKEGSRIVCMNDIDVIDAVFCYAAEFLRSLSNSVRLRMTVVPMPEKDVAAIRLKIPYDSFSIRARKDLPPVSGCTLNFKKGDVLQIIDSYKDYDPHTGGYKWLAIKSFGGGVYASVREGTVPAEQSIAYRADDYPEEEFDAIDDTKKKKKSAFFKAWGKRSVATEKYEENTVFAVGELYEYIDDVRI